MEKKKNNMETYHILPVDDTEPHEESENCKCCPVVEYQYGNKIVIHNSFDGREHKEFLFNNIYKN